MQIILLPSNSSGLYDLQAAVSPDGKWLTFHTGSPVDEPYDFALNLMSLPSGTIQWRIPLLADDFPQAVDGAEIGPRAMTIERMALNGGIITRAWSPDGRYLAFPRHAGGASSDLYLLDTLDGTIRRLTDDPLSVRVREWSPDGEWILYTNPWPASDYPPFDLHAIRYNSETVSERPTLTSGWNWFGLGWISPQFYVITSQGEGSEPFSLGYVNANNGQAVYLWPGMYFNDWAAIDPDNHLAALIYLKGLINDSPLESGLYFISLDGIPRRMSEQVFRLIEYRGGLTHRFLGIIDGIYGIALDGSVDLLSTRQDAQISLSPDKRWLGLYGSDGLELFSETDELVRSLSMPVEEILWLPDASEMLFSSQDTWYRLAVPDGEPIPFDLQYSEECGDTVILP
jgi:hypothetical protein